MTNINKYLGRIPDSILFDLIGKEIYNSIDRYSKIQEDKIKPDYAEILAIKEGSKLLFNREVYKKLILFLSDSSIKKIASENSFSDNTVENYREKILKKSFSYNNEDFCLNFLRALDLEKEKYFPPKETFDFEFSKISEPEFPLHQYQKRVKDSALNVLFDSSSPDKLLIHMPTGAGKTKTTMELLADYIRVKSINGGFEDKIGIVWLAHTKELCMQASESFRMTWKLRGDMPINIYDLYGDNKYPDELLSDEKFIVFAGFQKFYALRKSKKSLQSSIKEKLKKDVDLVVVDEAHKSLATTYQESIDFLTTSKFNQKLIGLTATPGRNSGDDKENKLLANFFNSSKITLQDNFGREIKNPIGYLQNLEILARLKKEELYTNIEVKLTENKLEELKLFGDEKLNEIISDLATHPGRNELIISRIESSVINNESILVFGCNVAHCLVLESLLKQKGIDAKSVLGETSKTDRAKIIDDFKNGKLSVLINYGVLTTGFDAPKLDTVMITRPTSSIVLYSQMIGRALRGPKNGGNKENLLIDIKDNFESESVQSMFTFFNEIWSN